MKPRSQHEYFHPTYLGWQVDWPLFVKMPFTAFGKYWAKGEHFNWHTQHGAQADKVAQLYGAGMVHHNPTREKEEKVGDRLYEFDAEDFKSICRLTNDKIKKITTTQQEFNRKKVKQSTLVDKQRGLIRSWLRNNPSLVEHYYEARDFVLAEKDAKLKNTEEV